MRQRQDVLGMSISDGKRVSGSGGEIPSVHGQFERQDAQRPPIGAGAALPLGVTKDVPSM